MNQINPFTKLLKVNSELSNYFRPIEFEDGTKLFIQPAVYQSVLGIDPSSIDLWTYTVKLDGEDYGSSFPLTQGEMQIVFEEVAGVAGNVK